MFRYKKEELQEMHNIVKYVEAGQFQIHFKKTYVYDMNKIKPYYIELEESEIQAKTAELKEELKGYGTTSPEPESLTKVVQQVEGILSFLYFKYKAVLKSKFSLKAPIITLNEFQEMHNLVRKYKTIKMMHD